MMEAAQRGEPLSRRGAEIAGRVADKQAVGTCWSAPRADTTQLHRCPLPLFPPPPCSSLLDYVRETKRLPEGEAAAIFQQLLHALQFCHRKDVRPPRGGLPCLLHACVDVCVV